MIDYLVSNQTKKFQLKRSNILKVINFLIFGGFLEFFELFLNFSGFILNLFKFINIKNSVLIHSDLVYDVCAHHVSHMYSRH